MAVHPQKITKALNRLTKALDACQEAGLQLQQVACQALQKGDHVVVNGVLDKIVAIQQGQVGVVALENAGEIMQLDANLQYLIVRSN
jgi:hypothetical protein